MNGDDEFAPGGGGGGTDEETKTFFAVGLYVPTIADGSGEPKIADEMTEAIEGHHLERLVAVPSDVFSNAKDKYTVEIPFTLWWNSNVDADEFGSVKVWMNNQIDETLDSPSGERTGTFQMRYETKDDVPAINYFRILDVDLNVRFEGDGELAELAPSQSIRKETLYSTPNKSAFNVKEVLDTAQTVTDEGLATAGRLTGVRKPTFLRKAARMLAYASVRGIDTVSEEDIGGDLVRNAAVKGIGGFKETVEEASVLANQLGERSLYTSMAGPTIKFDDFAPDIEVRPSSPTAREEVTLGPSWSTVPDVPIEQYDWTVETNDGTLDRGSGETFTVSFPREGTYSVSLRTTDEDGNEGSARRSVSVDP
jgi:hypothetical protein